MNPSFYRRRFSRRLTTLPFSSFFTNAFSDDKLLYPFMQYSHNGEFFKFEPLLIGERNNDASGRRFRRLSRFRKIPRRLSHEALMGLYRFLYAAPGFSVMRTCYANRRDIVTVAQTRVVLHSRLMLLLLTQKEKRVLSHIRRHIIPPLIRHFLCGTRNTR